MTYKRSKKRGPSADQMREKAAGMFRIVGYLALVFAALSAILGSQGPSAIWGWLLTSNVPLTFLAIGLTCFVLIRAVRFSPSDWRQRRNERRLARYAEEDKFTVCPPKDARFAAWVLSVIGRAGMKLTGLLAAFALLWVLVLVGLHLYSSLTEGVEDALISELLLRNILFWVPTLVTLAGIFAIPLWMGCMLRLAIERHLLLSDVLDSLTAVPVDDQAPR